MQNLQPIRRQRLCSKDAYKATKSGYQVFWCCPLCPHSGLTRRNVANHITTKHNINMNNEHLQSEDISKIQNNYQKMKQEFDQQKKTIQTMKNDLNLMIEKVNIYQLQDFQNINQIVSQIMKDSDVFLRCLSISLYGEIQVLLARGIKAGEIVNKAKQIIIQKVKTIKIVDQFDVFEKKFAQYESIFKQKSGLDAKYKRKLLKAIQFLKKYKHYDFKYQHVLISDLSAEPIWKRKLVFRVFRNMRTQYSDWFNFTNLPTRLIKTEKRQFLQRVKVTIDQIKEQLQNLRSESNYQLATDIWLCVCLGLRSRQMKKVFFTDQQGDVVDTIKIWQYKNNNYTSRIVPSSLRGMISKHMIKYPITERRWKTVSKHCLNKFKSFYGLRSLCITSIVGCVLKSSQFTKFHKLSQTTLRYYIDLTSRELINNVFKYHEYEHPLSGKINIIHPNTNEIVYQASVQKNVHIIESHNELLNTTQLDAIYINKQLKTEQILIAQKEIEQGIQASDSKFESIAQIFDEQSVNNNQFLAKISTDCQLPFHVVQFASASNQSRLQKSIGNQFEETPVRIVKEKLENGTTIYRLDESSYVRQQIIQRRRVSRSRNLTLSYNWPIVKKKISCLKCKGNLMIENCRKHYDLKCQSCNFSYHKCQLARGNPIQQHVYCQNYEESALKFDCVKLTTNKNNIKQTIQNQNRTQINKILFLDSTPKIHSKFPKFSQMTKKQLQLIRNNEEKLPIEIKMTKKRGKGVYANEQIAKNSIICLYNGLIVRGEAANNKDDSIIQIGMIKEGQEIINLTLDASTHCNIGRYINSSSGQNSSRKNCGITMGLIQNHGQCQIVIFLFSIHEIQKGDELLWWYGQEYWNTLQINPVSQIQSEDGKDEQIDLDIASSHENNSEQQVMYLGTPKKKKKIEKRSYKSQSEKQQKSKIQEAQFQSLQAYHDQNSKLKEQDSMKKKLNIESLQVMEEVYHQLKMELIQQKHEQKQEQKQQYKREQMHEQNLDNINQMKVQSIQIIETKKQKKIKAFGVYSGENYIINNQNQQLQIASVIKLLVVKVVISFIDKGLQNYETQIPLTMYNHRGTTASLIPKKKYTIRQLIEAALIASACQASYCLAYHFGKIMLKEQNQKKCIQRFENQMQFHAQSLKMLNTKVKDVTGLGKSTSTVSDLFYLVKWVMEEKQLVLIFNKRSIAIQKTCLNTNSLIYEQIVGKTGTGENALHCFAGFQEEFIIIILGANQRQIAETKSKQMIKKLKKNMKVKK